MIYLYKRHASALIHFDLTHIRNKEQGSVFGLDTVALLKRIGLLLWTHTSGANYYHTSKQQPPCFREIWAWEACWVSRKLELGFSSWPLYFSWSIMFNVNNKGIFLSFLSCSSKTYLQLHFVSLKHVWIMLYTEALTLSGAEYASTSIKEETPPCNYCSLLTLVAQHGGKEGLILN